MLQNTVLDFLQSVMVAVKDLSRLLKVDLFGFSHSPLEGRDKIKIIIQGVVLRSVGRFLLKTAKDPFCLLLHVLGHTAMLYLVLEAGLILLALRIHLIEFFLEDTDLFLDRCLLIIIVLLIVAAGHIDLQIDRALEPQQRIMNQRTSFLKGIRGQQGILLLLGHIKELTEGRGKFIHSLDRPDELDRILAASDVRSQFRRLFAQLLK